VGAVVANGTLRREQQKSSEGNGLMKGARHTLSSTLWLAFSSVCERHHANKSMMKDERGKDKDSRARRHHSL
jgi:hypothetical protein